MNTHSPLFRSLAHLLIAVIWAQPLHSIAANLQLDHLATGNTQVSAAQNGVPVVNIATPNSKGLSHNKFIDYNVGQQGLILNNSTNKLVQTQLGGIIFGNSQLNGKAANTILNEVTGGQRSQLKGYTEVAGQKAHVIVANPHGISCNGCGFINTPQATLTTGRPMIEQGRLQGYDVKGGDIEISGAGLNASNVSRFDLITRSAKINAELHANQLNIVTGLNQVEAGSLKATAKTDTVAEPPLLAIDSSALGGMYAGAIRLVGTEAGVGVRLAGDMAASAGDIQIDTKGQLSLARTAASKDIRLAATEIQLDKDVFAGQTAQLTTPKLEVKGSLLAGGTVAIEVGKIENQGLIEAGIKADGSLNPKAQLNVQAELLSNRSSISSQGELKIQAQNLDNHQGHIASLEQGSLQVEQLTNAQGSIVSQRNLSVEAQQLHNQDGSLVAVNNLILQADKVTNDTEGLIVAGAHAHLAISDSLENSGQLQAGQDLQLVAKAVNNSGSLGAGADVVLSADGIHNDQGLILSGGSMQLTGRQITNRRGNIYSLGNILIDARDEDAGVGRFSNLSGSLEATGDLWIQADHLANAREDFAIRSYKYSARLTHLGCIDCSGDKKDALFRLDEIDRTEVIRNSPQSELLSGGNMLLQADNIDNWYSLMAAAGDMQLVANKLDNRGAQTGDVSQSRVLHAHRVRDVGYHLWAANQFNRRNWHGSASYRPGNIAADINSFINSHIWTMRPPSTPVVTNVEYHHGVIQAGGSLQITAEQQLNNSLIQPSFAYVSGGSRADGALATLVSLNPQQMTDLSQQPLSVALAALPLGSQGLFRMRNTPGHSYLVETNPALTQMRNFLSSDYLFGQLGLDTDAMQKRLGDGFFEQRLIRDALLARTGQRFIAGIHSDEALFRYLMDNAIASKEALELSVGVSLTAEQVAALTHDIVWMETQEVMGEQVLVPVLYMAQTKDPLTPSGALIQGQDLALMSGGDLSNQGSLQATHFLGAQANNINNSGQMSAGEQLLLFAEDSINNRQGGLLTGRDIELMAHTGDIVNELSVTRHLSAQGGSRWETSFADSAARIEAANSLSLQAGRDVQNLGGVLQSGGDMQVIAGRDLHQSSIEERHAISHGSHYLTSQTAQLISQTLAGGDLSMEAGRNLSAVASRIESGQDMQLLAANDLTLAAAANESHDYSKSKKVTSQRDKVRQQGTELRAGGNLLALSGRDTQLTASQVSAGDEAYLVAGGKLELLAAQDVDYSFFEKKKKGSWGRKSYRMNESEQLGAVTTAISAGSNLLIQGAESIATQGTQLQAGQQLELQSAGDILLLAAEQSSSQASAKSKSGLLSSKGKASSQSQTQLLGTAAQADSLLIDAGQDLRLNAGYLRAEQDMVLQAGRDLELSSGLEYSSQSQQKYSSKFGFGHFALPSLTQKQQAAKQGAATPQGSYLSAGQLLVNAQRDLEIVGSRLVSEGDMSLQSGRQLNILAAEGRMHSQSSSSSKKSGSIGQGWLPALGQVKQKVTTQSDSQQQHSSQLASLGGNIDLQAAGNYQQTASILLAPEGDISIQAKQVAIQAGYDQFNWSESRSMSSTALGATVQVPLIEAAQNLQGLSKARSRVDDSRLQRLASLLMLKQGVSAYSSAKELYNRDFSGIKLGVNLGSSKSKSSSQQQGQQAVSSAVIAGGNIDIQALGAADSDVLITGSSLQAGQDISLLAERHIQLQAAKNSMQHSSKQTGSGWSIGASFGLGGAAQGISFNAAVNSSNGKSQGSDTWWTNAQLDAGNLVRLESGADTRLQGAVVSGEQIVAKVGGDLVLQSLQDTSNYSSSQSSSGLSAGLCIPPFCAGSSSLALDLSTSKAQSEQLTVSQQTGLLAGDAGFQIEVAGHTDLTAALIASSEQAAANGLNSLDTGTLAVRDLYNFASAKAKTSGISLSTDYFSQGKYGLAKGVYQNHTNQGAASAANTGYSLSAISPGEVRINDPEGQLQLTGLSLEDTLASLRRDTSNTHLASTALDVQKLERKAEAAKAIRNAATAEATRLTDEAYRVIFIEEAILYEVQRDAEGQVKKDANGEPLIRQLTAEDEKHLARGFERVKLFFNGIFNIKESAAEYGAQMPEGEDDVVYVLHFPKANNGVSELLVAGYQKFMENDFWGLSNSAVKAQQLAREYGNTGLELAGHSRGSMTIFNTLQSLQRKGEQGVLENTQVYFYGPAANAYQTAGLLHDLSNGKQDRVFLQNHAYDFVGTGIGGNPGTYSKVPEGSNRFKESLKIFGKQPTVHGCAGKGNEKCETTYGIYDTLEIIYKAR